MRTVFSVLAVTGILVFVTPGKIFSYSILIDASGASYEQIPDCINFIVETRNLPYSIILPDKMEPWEKKIVNALGQKSDYRIVCRLEPQIWLQGVATLGVSDIDDVLMKIRRKFSGIFEEPLKEIFIGPQTIDEETAVRFSRHGIRTVYCGGATGNFKSGVNILSCSRADRAEDFSGNILYAKTDSFADLKKFLTENPPSPFDFSERSSTRPSTGIILDSVNLKLWELFVQSRRAIEDYKNSGNASGEKLATVLEIAYSIEDLSNWRDSPRAGRIFRSVSDIYSLTGIKPPYEFGSVSDIFFEELKKLPVSVSEKGFEYSISDKDGFLYIEGSFDAALTASTPVEIYWWNPAMIFSAREGVGGDVLDSPVNFCLFLTDKCYFYSSSKDGWQRLWSVFTVERSSGAFSIKMPRSYLQLAGKTNVSFFIKAGNFRTGLMPVSLPKSFIYKKWLDMVGDAKGPGWYELPEGVPSGMGDIMSVSVWENSRGMSFQFHFAGPLWDEKWSAGLDFYIDINGIKKRGNGLCRKGLNCFLCEEAFWEYCLVVSNRGAFLLKGEEKIDVSVKFDSSSRIATVTIDKKVFAYKPEKCKFTFCSYLTDEKGLPMEVKEKKDAAYPGGGNPALKSPNILDIIVESRLKQKQVLGDYLKKRGVRIPAL